MLVVKNNEKYYLKDNKEYLSVTKLVNRLFPFFDVTKVASLVAKKENCTIEEVLKKWSEKTEEGKSLHNFIENEIYFSGKINFLGKELCLLEHINDLIFQDGILSEYEIYSDKHLVAGTVDLICKIQNNIYIIDFKTGIDNRDKLFKKYQRTNLKKYRDYRGG
jgi:ATP-dependent exoDNAse (exonuclease V) beta subunit